MDRPFTPLDSHVGNRFLPPSHRFEAGSGWVTTLFVKGASFGTCRADWVTILHHFIKGKILTENSKAGEVYARRRHHQYKETCGRSKRRYDSLPVRKQARRLQLCLQVRYAGDLRLPLQLDVVNDIAVTRITLENYFGADYVDLHALKKDENT